MALPAKLGVALVVALASNVSLFSMLLFPKKTGVTSTEDPLITTTTTTATLSLSSSSSNNNDLGGEPDESLRRVTERVDSSQPNSVLVGEEKRPHGHLREEREGEGVGEQGGGLGDSGLRNGESKPAEAGIAQTGPPPTDGGNRREGFHPDDEDLDHGAEEKDLHPRMMSNGDPPRDLDQRDPHPAPQRDFEAGREAGAPGPTEMDVRSRAGSPDTKAERDVLKNGSEEKREDPEPKKTPRSRKEDPNPGSEMGRDLNPGPDDAKPTSVKAVHREPEKNPSAGSERDRGGERTDPPPGPETGPATPRRGDIVPGRDLRGPSTPRRGDIIPGPDPYSRPTPQPAFRGREDSDHHLHDVIATLTDRELRQFDAATAKTVIPALRALETLVLRELGQLGDIARHQERRLQRLEQHQIPKAEVREAVRVIREEQRKLRGEPPSPQPAEPSGTQPSNSSAAKDAQGADDHLARSDNSGDGSGGDEETTTTTSETIGATMTTTTTAPSRANSTERSDEMIINHIYEMYNSLTSVEHKVTELDSRLRSVSSEVYRERGTSVRLEDNVAEISRHQKHLLMKATMHGFTLSDLEQFKGQAERVLGSAEGRVEQCDAQLEVFTDRMMEEQDEVAIMRDVFPRLQQVSTEFRSADALKTHDLQELRRGYQQIEGRLNSLHHTLDQSVSNIRWDVKTYLDHLCATNSLQC